MKNFFNNIRVWYSLNRVKAFIAMLVILLVGLLVINTLFGDTATIITFLVFFISVVYVTLTFNPQR